MNGCEGNESALQGIYDAAIGEQLDESWQAAVASPPSGSNVQIVESNTLPLEKQREALSSLIKSTETLLPE